jgi:hypothetical protein
VLQSFAFVGETLMGSNKLIDLFLVGAFLLLHQLSQPLVLLLEFKERQLLVLLLKHSALPRAFTLVGELLLQLVDIAG